MLVARQAVADEKYLSRLNWQYMVLDEAQSIKSSARYGIVGFILAAGQSLSFQLNVAGRRGSQRFAALARLPCRNRLLLTGTPIQNTMKEVGPHGLRSLRSVSNDPRLLPAACLQLWALLNFIMPTLFDSHEEFSEWFSKDIESHAADKGGSNLDQGAAN